MSPGGARRRSSSCLNRTPRERILPARTQSLQHLKISTQPAFVAMRRAVERCIVKDPKKRWSALDIAYGMMDTLDMLLEEKDNQTATNGTIIAKQKNGTITEKPNNITVIGAGGDIAPNQHTSHNRTMTKKRNESNHSVALASRRLAKQVGELTN